MAPSAVLGPRLADFLSPRLQPPKLTLSSHHRPQDFVYTAAAPTPLDLTLLEELPRSAWSR